MTAPLVPLSAIHGPMKNLTVEGRLDSLTPPERTEGGHTKQEGVLTDGVKTIRVSFWDSYAGVYHDGDRIRIENAHVILYDDQLELKTGKYGRIVLCS